MTLSLTLLALSPGLLTPAPPPPLPDLLAIKVGRAETVSQGTIEHAVILVEDGRIVMVGEDLPIERGIPVLDRDPEWTAMPGLVNCYSRLGMDGSGPNNSRPGAKASGELYPAADEYPELLRAGVTTLGLYPAGNGIPGRAVAVRPHGDTVEEMILADSVYLKVLLRSNGSSKKMIRDGFEKADKWIEKEAKEREKWEKKKEKWEKDQKKKKDDKDKKEEDAKEEEEKLEPYAPPEKDGEETAFLQLRSGELKALISISSAADYLHLLDAIGDEEFSWDLRVPISREIDIFHVEKEVGLTGRRVVMEPELSLHPNTMRQRNLPAEFARAGAELVLVPRSDSVSGHEDWLRHVGEIVATGLPRETAIKALTLAPAEVMGLGERLGSLDEGKDANLIFLNGDPFEPGTEIEAVMLEGHIVAGEVDL